MPRMGEGPATGVPSTVTVPAVGCRKPATMLRSVDFPQPDGPRRQTNSPRPLTLQLDARQAIDMLPTEGKALAETSNADMRR